MTSGFFAHSSDGQPPDNWQPLEEHLKNVAVLARSFADAFSAGDWAYVAGLWHDLGKYSKAFQDMLLQADGTEAHIETKRGRVDHSTAGAQHAVKTLKHQGKLLAYAIAGHHSGLPDGASNESSCLIKRLEKEIGDYSSCPDSILKVRHDLANVPFAPDKKRFGLQLAFFTRMIYSTLVDADFLDTETFMDPMKSSWRKGYPSLIELNKRLASHLDELVACSPSTFINKQRANILEACLKAAENPQGLFSLTVPTGGGKTLSSLAFALKHALKHELERIIYVIPYTSIIEQNAEVFRDILGEQAVLEHHSNFEPEEEDRRSRLTSENWDAPLIVTTNVQFFESLFARRSSRCRKIHNIAKSVVILDEAQILPVPLLKPCLEILRELTSAYNTTIVLCTATQPALSTTESFKDGLDNVTEIIPNPKQLYTGFKRVRFNNLAELSNEELADIIINHEQVLCIVNTRKNARTLFELIREHDNCYHLSGFMCPQHRTEILSKIKTLLKNNQPCRVVSTQLVEAGVDVDFPVVFRAMTGIDSIAQAAGRCNREGRLPENGQLYIFSPESSGKYRQFQINADIAEMVMRHHEDPLSLEAVEEYFKNLFWIKGDQLDVHQILKILSEGASAGNFPFKEVDEKFKIIQDDMVPIIIPFNQEAQEIIQGLRYAEHTGLFARRAQRFIVQVYPNIANSLEHSGSIERLQNQYLVLINQDLYNKDLGLCAEDPTFHDVESLIQ
ncbi:MAG: CRISPR-associated helicase Cas3' [Deltaproteobacteria bacterium]|nr:CRISPR-associated helicase Cas3' [Deltaproteobacteria bacterium]